MGLQHLPNHKSRLYPSIQSCYLLHFFPPLQKDYNNNNIEDKLGNLPLHKADTDLSRLITYSAATLSAMQNGPWVQGHDALEYNLAGVSLSIMENKCIFELLEEEVILLLMMGKLKKEQRGDTVQISPWKVYMLFHI